ncbi:hypothetical protein BJX99DRAFT_257960 [Aspergillus californicus]
MEQQSQIENTTSSTLHLLESRLHRLTYLLTGDTTWSGTPVPPEKPASHEETVSRRLNELEQALEGLRAKGGVVREVLGVYDRFPDLFKSIATTTSDALLSPQPGAIATSPSIDPSNPDTELDTAQSQSQSLPEIDPKTLTSLVLSHATTYPETASRLTSLSDTPIPDAQLSASLIALQPRLDKLASIQNDQMSEIAELRVRTARVLQRWYEVSVLGGGEVWGEWEGRVEGVEKGVRREEIARERL